MYDLISLTSICTHENTTAVKIMNIPFILKSFHVPLCETFLLPPLTPSPSNHRSVFCYFQLFVFSGVSHKCNKMKYTLFRSGFSHSAWIILRLIHIVVCTHSLFLSNPWAVFSLFLHSPVDEYLGHFLFLVIISKAAMIICVQVCLETYIFLSFE